MRTITLIVLALFLATTSYGQRKTANDLRQKHSAYYQLKTAFETKEANATNPKTPDLMKIIRQREFSRLLQVYNLYHFESQFDTISRLSYFYEGFDHLPNHSIEEYYTGSVFSPSNRTFYHFDAQERDTMWVSQYWQDWRNYVNSMREIWRYDHMDNQYLSMTEFWDENGEQWYLNFASRSSYAYDSAGRVLSITYAEYYMDQWFPWGRILNQYDDQGRHVSTIGQDWEEVDGKWVNSWHEQYQLNAQNEWEVVKYYFWNDFNQEWELDSKATDITWLDFSQFKWLTVTLQLWDGQNWENDMKGFCVYNPAQLLLSTTFQMWDGTAWVNDSRERYEYDQYQFTTLEAMEYWEGGTWVIGFAQRFTPEYDANANPVSILVEFYDWELSTWVISSKVLLVWETVTGIPQPKPLEFSIYPNPAHTQIFLKVIEVMSGNLEYAIYNASSRLMGLGRLTGHAIDVAALPSGSYVLQLKHNGQTTTRKFIKR